jgi:hypothetical protein
MPQQPKQPSRIQRMRAAGYTPREARLVCDAYGKRFARQVLPAHNCTPDVLPERDTPPPRLD